MRIDQARLRTIIAEADAANAAVYPLTGRLNAIRKEITDLKNALDPDYRFHGQDGAQRHKRFPENEKSRAALRAELSAALKRFDDLSNESDQLQAKATTLGRLATACRDHARCHDQMPPDLERN